MNTHELTRIAQQLTAAFDAHTLCRLAREQEFLRRLRTITPERLGLALVTAFASQQLETLADLHRCFNALHAEHVTYKPFYKQLAKDAFPAWMAAFVQHLLEKLVVRVLRPVAHSPLAQFSQILIQDSSGLQVHPALAADFPGRFPKAPAVAEIHATFNVGQDQVVRLSLTPQRCDPRGELPTPESLAGRLLLADRGYPAAEYCRQVAAAGGAFLIRGTRKINPRVRRVWVAGQEQREWAGKRLSEVRSRLEGRDADLDIEFPRARKRPEPVSMRLVLSWHPELKKHLYLLTNLTRETFPPAAVQHLYRLRWQIELVFKEWKSYVNLHAFRTEKEPITRGLLWAALAAALLHRYLAHAAQVTSGPRPGRRPISTRRAVMALGQFLPRLCQELRRPALPRLRKILRELLGFLRQHALRSNPTREAKGGRASFGLEPIYHLAA